MIAAVCDVFGKPLTIREVPTPSPGPGELLIRVHGCGVCHSDLHLGRRGLGGVGNPPSDHPWPRGDRHRGKDRRRRDRVRPGRPCGGAVDAVRLRPMRPVQGRGGDAVRGPAEHRRDGERRLRGVRIRAGGVRPQDPRRAGPGGGGPPALRGDHGVRPPAARGEPGRKDRRGRRDRGVGASRRQDGVGDGRPRGRHRAGTGEGGARTLARGPTSSTRRRRRSAVR